MTKRSKRMKEVDKLVEVGREYSLEEAVTLLKKCPAPKFDQSLNLMLKIGVDPKKSDQQVRGTVTLPHGTGQKVGLVVIARADMMRELGKLGKILGPRGLMPTPKAGTVTTDVAKAVRELKAGKIEFKVDKTGNVNSAVGKASFPKESLMENLLSLLNAISRAKPAAAKGAYFRSLYLSSTMGPGLKIDLQSIQLA